MAPSYLSLQRLELDIGLYLLCRGVIMSAIVAEQTLAGRLLAG